MATQRTIADLPPMTDITCEMNETYCEHCMVASVTTGDKYCTMCARDIADYLAEQYKEQIAVEKGLY